jgi:phytol kinase
MKEQIVITALLGLSFLVLFGIAELLYHYGKVKAEITRKTVHIGTGILTLYFRCFWKAIGRYYFCAAVLR